LICIKPLDLPCLILEKSTGVHHMNSRNYSLITADRLTHLKVVIIALVAGIAIIAGAVAATRLPSDMSTQLEARAPVLKAPNAIIWTSNGQVTVR
jgi:hypothetical protein